jgi:hypothetical protein
LIRAIEEEKEKPGKAPAQALRKEREEQMPRQRGPNKFKLKNKLINLIN